MQLGSRQPAGERGAVLSGSGGSETGPRGGGGARVKQSACVSVAAPGAEGRTEAGGVEERRGRAQRRRIP